MKFLITGATGDVGSKVVLLLLQRGETPRIMARNANKARSYFGDRVEVFGGDLGDKTALRNALDGVEEFFLVNSGSQIPVRDALAAEAAVDAGVRHIVKLSSMDVEQGLAIGAWHEKGEAAIRASGIRFTFVRPSGFMTNLLAWAPAIRNEGVVCSSTASGRRPFIHSQDIAAVAVEALMTRDYDGQTLSITGAEAVCFADIAVCIAAHTGKQLRFECISDEEARRRYAAIGAPEEETEAHVALWRAIREGRLASVTRAVEHVLGKVPIGLDQWIEENLAAFQ
jgi:uncharacterized protein YbjT (DUF2867 family)